MESENQRIKDIIKIYREHFKLTRVNIAILSGLKKSAYTALEMGTGNIDFDKINAISKIYGLQIWEFINPKQKIPALEELPFETKKLALAQKDRTVYTKNSNLKLPEKIKIILNSGELPTEFTASDIWKLLPGDVRKNIKTTRITDTISRESFSKVIDFTGKKRGKEKIYKLK
ncbi:helix-turn-helix domain-containing protein [Elizabethkingia anophelis]|uniref:HTH cro/C1-type domain-containing protein n=1 Tax=Elizabethkingia anophelis TaxID=1117645 RepID=A0AAU8USR9_9FLAO|nr:helix-turn-helix transcriptional regulator [Elizabethkingia anophelis]AQX00492.1 hypothetical protein BBD32_02920 [Elizabethkingia anophelis]OPB66260.1 hypothetical protein BAY11_14950 [Elizabethkingia anophelis]